MRVANRVRLELHVEGRSVTIVECRSPWSINMGSEWTRFPIARLRFSASRRQWMLYHRDRNLRFRMYPGVEPTADVAALLDEIEADPSGIFWG